MKHNVVIYKHLPDVYGFACYGAESGYKAKWTCGSDLAPTARMARELGYLHATGHNDVLVDDLTLSRARRNFRDAVRELVNAFRWRR